MLLAGCSTMETMSPRAEIIAARREAASLEAEPNSIALMLPLTGEFAAASRAIRSGFLAAYYQDHEAKPNVNIKLLDTTAANIQELYQQAINDGAEVIVGPLIKKDVEILAKMHTLSVPTIALNTLDDYTHSYATNLYQFGLLPQDEATQAALRMLRDGITHCVAMVPAGAWGKKILHTFTDTYEGSGGKIVAALSYNPRVSLTEQFCPFLAENPEELCNPTAKTSNKNSDRSTPQPTRRQDINGIFFIASTPTMARQIVPLLKFYYAGDLPTYSISSIYDGTPAPTLDRDLDGVYFCDMPWTLQFPPTFTKELGQIHEQISRDSSVVTKYYRLYALGIDVYQIATKLNEFFHHSHLGMNGASGKLYLDNSNHIYRELQWAKMFRGIPKSLP